MKKQSFRQWLFDKLLQLAHVRRPRTLTERAFLSMAELDKMWLYVRDNDLYDCCAEIPREVMKKYGIRYSYEVWAALYKAAESKKVVEK